MMQVGDVVVPAKHIGRVFHCGSGCYSHAIVASIAPFVLVSSGGDMLWSCTWSPSEVVALCQASEAIQKVVRERIERTNPELLRKGGEK